MASASLFPNYSLQHTIFVDLELNEEAIKTGYVLCVIRTGTILPSIRLTVQGPESDAVSLYIEVMRNVLSYFLSYTSLLYGLKSYNIRFECKNKEINDSIDIIDYITDIGINNNDLSNEIKALCINYNSVLIEGKCIYHS